MTLTQKERTLLEDLKTQEQICIEKYSKYASQASDTQLKDLFTQIGQKEQQHLDTINQILNGMVPSVSSSSGQSGQQSGQQGQSQGSQWQGGQNQSQNQNQSSQGMSASSTQSGSNSTSQSQQSGNMGQSQNQSQQGGASGQSQGSSNMSNDNYLCTDALSTEKHVSSTYNIAIFEMKDVNLRNVLNHIQKEEQEHGQQIYNYMAQHGMYS